MKPLIILIVLFILTGSCLAKINPQDAVDYGMREGVLKGITIAYKAFKSVDKDKKHQAEFLKALAYEASRQKEYEKGLVRK